MCDNNNSSISNSSSSSSVMSQCHTCTKQLLRCAHSTAFECLSLARVTSKYSTYTFQPLLLIAATLPLATAVAAANSALVCLMSKVTFPTTQTRCQQNHTLSHNHCVLSSAFRTACVAAAAATVAADTHTATAATATAASSMLRTSRTARASSQLCSRLNKTLLHRRSPTVLQHSVPAHTPTLAKHNIS
eukprot:16053-Heterococcus_DN1.PRE.2